jgi:hypothetical protein
VIEEVVAGVVLGEEAGGAGLGREVGVALPVEVAALHHAGGGPGQ